ncbi:hypothetical protein HOD29_04840 [archaeon]|jgi:hypothetical protein|nr:hypothetical protein [archaeon]
MKKENYFFLIFILSIILIRVLLYFYPISGPTIEGFRTHHYMYGILLLIFAKLFKDTTLFSIGSALFIDELMLILTNSWTYADYFSTITLIGTIIFSIIFFIFRKNIFTFSKNPISHKKIKLKIFKKPS